MNSEPGKQRKVWFKGCLGWLLKGFLFIVLLIAADYLYEDWHGMHVWTKTKADFKAAGISLDPHTYIPPPVPNAENFGALPIFKLEPDPKHKEVFKPLALDRALKPIYEHFSYSKDQASKTGMLPWLGNGARGEKPDISEVQKQLTELCREATPPIQVPAKANPSEMLGLLCPALSELRAANTSHPACRFEHRYTDLTSMLTTNFWSMTEQIKLTKVLSYEEQLALYDNQPQLVLDDLNVDWKIVSGLQKEPLILSGLVCAGVVSMQLEVMREGLDQHVWNDRQLAELDGALGKIDFLTETPLCLRGDFTIYAIPWTGRIKKDRFFAIRNAREEESEYDQKLDWRTYLFLLATCWPTSDGDWDRGLADYARVVILGSMPMVDSASRRVFPEKEPSLAGLTSQVQSALHCVKQFAYAQVQVDEARIACRLERYRLAHDLYPATLDALMPAYGPDLPHDIMNGDPFHYKINGDGTYLLYSVGWNQKDDGGDSGSARYQDSPDWIWANYSDVQKSK